MVSKEKIRSKILLKRKLLSTSDIFSLSSKIKENFLSLKEMSSSKSINCYVSKDSEVYTHDLIKQLINLNKIVSVPYLIDDNIAISEIRDFGNLEKGKFNILEPKVIACLNPSDLNIILVPGIAFDRNKNRIGYGRGYYDKFLKKTKGLKIGLGYSFQIVRKILPEQYDIKLDILITDKEIIR
jgi:5-formyltetrahydrofolate cyclo-ligase